MALVTLLLPVSIPFWTFLGAGDNDNAPRTSEDKDDQALRAINQDL